LILARRSQNAIKNRFNNRLVHTDYYQALVPNVVQNKENLQNVTFVTPTPKKIKKKKGAVTTAPPKTAPTAVPVVGGHHLPHAPLVIVQPLARPAPEEVQRNAITLRQLGTVYFIVRIKFL